ncbi:hypothetical protein AB0R12_29435, partial [Streptomyces niveus]
AAYKGTKTQFPNYSLFVIDGSKHPVSAGRNAVEREHRILRHSHDGDLETVYGVVTEAGKPMGSFLSAAVITPEGRMARYQSYFTTTYDLIDPPEQQERQSP